HLGAFVLAPHSYRQLLEPLERYRAAPGRSEIGLGGKRELVGLCGRDAGRDQRPREQALRERQPVLAARRQRLTVPAPAAATGSAWAWSARASRAGSSSGWPVTGTISLATSTTWIPRLAPASATTSIAAALISVRNTSASTPSSSRRSAVRSARLPETWTTS